MFCEKIDCWYLADPPFSRFLVTQTFNSCRVFCIQQITAWALYCSIKRQKPMWNDQTTLIERSVILHCGFLTLSFEIQQLHVDVVDVSCSRMHIFCCLSFCYSLWPHCNYIALLYYEAGNSKTNSTDGTDKLNILMDVLSCMINIPLITGCPPARWLQASSVCIKK